MFWGSWVCGTVSLKLHIQVDSLFCVFCESSYCYVTFNCNTRFFHLDPGIPSNIIVSDVTMSSMKIDWSTSGTNVVNFTTVNYTCANDMQMQNVNSSTSTVLSNLKPGCNYFFCIIIRSFDQTASNCSSAITRADYVIFLCPIHLNKFD